MYSVTRNLLTFISCMKFHVYLKYDTLIQKYDGIGWHCSSTVVSRQVRAKHTYYYEDKIYISID